MTKMSSTNSSVASEKIRVEKLFEKIQVSSSSEEPPMDQWSSLCTITPSDSPKMALYKKGLFDPGSGEICLKYIPMSDSDVLNHLYYAYPSVKDPGILEALLKPEFKKIYSLDGQELYLDICEEMGIVPVRSFHRSLLDDVINLRYYCVNPVGVRAMCLALAYNRYVRRLDLTSNHLSQDACLHLGQLLATNVAIQELVLSGCKIRPEGLQKLVVNLYRHNLDLLDLSKNDIGDKGIRFLAHQFERGAIVKSLNLSFNDLSTDAALTFSGAIEWNNTIVNLDLSWNRLSQTKGSNELFRRLGQSKVLTELNMSWNGLTTGPFLRRILNVKTLKVLDLSNNRLSTPAAKAIAFKLPAAKKLSTLDLSHNPLTPSDARHILHALKDESVNLENLIMNDVAVSKEFVTELEEIQSLDYRAKTKVIFGRVLRNYTLSMPDIRTIVMKRFHYLTTSQKKCHLDIALYFLQQRKEREFMPPRELVRDLKLAHAPVDDGLIEELMRTFPGPKVEKTGKTINLNGVVEFIHRLWPEKKLPPTPPPAPVPEVLPKRPKKKGKPQKK